MKAFNNLKTSVKLVLGFGVVILVLIAVAYMGYSNMKNINDGKTSMYFDRLLPIYQIGVANTEETNLELYLFGMIIHSQVATQDEPATSTPSPTSLGARYL